MALLPGCRRATHNGEIDGYWQIRSIEYTKADGSTRTVIPNKTQDWYIGIQLELFQIGAPQPQYQLTGEISYDKKAGKLGVNFPYNPSAAVLLQFGIPSNPVTFTVEKADSKALVLSTASTRITCRRW